jgi:hypothetical protein
MKLLSITAALKHHQIPLHAQSVLQMLTWAGLVEEVEYLSSTGSGEVKTFQRLTAAGLQYGENTATLSPTKTEIKVRVSAIPELVRACHRGFSEYLATASTSVLR